MAVPIRFKLTRVDLTHGLVCGKRDEGDYIKPIHATGEQLAKLAVNKKPGDEVVVNVENYDGLPYIRELEPPC